MNEQVRKRLIEVARTNAFISYSDLVKECALPYDLQTEKGRHDLSVDLGEVSAFENENERHLLSSLAIYKDEKRNDHGDGFYRIAESLGKGTFKVLKDRLYGFEEAQKCREYWQDEENYRKEFPALATQDIVEDVPFFTMAELEFFKQWQLKPYDATNEEHYEAKEFIMDTVWDKMKYLGNRILDKIDGFDEDSRRYWSQRGWRETEDGIMVQSPIFKPYAWIKLFRDTDKGKDIFFTFEINASENVEAFAFKIDCQRERDNLLTKEQISLFDSMRPVETRWNEIGFEELLSLTWEKLTSICVQFIQKFITHYDAIVEAIWGAPIPPDLFKNHLIEREKPNEGFEKMPESNRTFEGVDIDFEKEAKEKKEIGNAGEELVMQREIAFLIEKKMEEEASKVEIIKDGKGYDVLSFDEHGNTKYIEVKTTTGNVLTPFYLSDNEFDFMKLNVGKYFIYRLYNFDLENNFGEFFILNEDVANQLIMKPTAYKVVIKKEA